MGIFGALTTSVAGLRAESYALENISGNIANSQTTAFKRIDTSFLDLIPQSGSDQQLAGSVKAESRSTNTIQGSIEASSVATYVAINGDGFFVVQKPGNFSDNNPVFTGVDYYTRRGDFALDKNGYLVNGAGYYLEGVPIDRTTGNPVGSSATILQFQNDFLPSQATTQIQYRANLASYPLTQKADRSVPGSELLNPTSYTPGHNPRVIGTPAPAFTDAIAAGTAQNSKLGTPNTAATLLSGAPATDSIGTNFAAGDTITVNGTPITFVAAGAVGNQLNIGDSISTLLAKIDSITGAATASSIVGGAINLHTGTASDLSITTSNAAALGALGLTNPVNQARNGGGTPGAGVVIGDDDSVFQSESVSGGAITTFDANGAPVNLQFRWAKVDNAAQGAGHADTWNLFYQVNPNATGTQTAWANAGTNFSFAAGGQLNPPIGSITLSNLTIAGVALGDVNLSFGKGGLTQFADTNGNVQVNQLQQDGFSAGQLQSVSVSNEGRVVGSYSNGRNIDLAQIALATFNGPNFLKRIDGGAFEVTNESGQALFGKAGTISGSSLEGSNTDIAEEFTKLIVTQQAYSANTRVITTANTMIQDLLNVLR